ncbi:Na+/H+ antiporter subunit E [Roseococcus sp. YIM B11640]|uniref:Na+/H+ antiporter subunit E n=1 Tax=Roseococcus sp. YIM B11640 TaxID=3133973 RepID=UPI003C7CC497
MSLIRPRHPFVVLAIFLMWMLLNETVSPGPALVGIAVALTGGWLYGLIEDATGRLHRPGLALRLAADVTYDVVMSNIAVTRVILERRGTERQSGFIRIPVQMRHPFALASLAIILTATPGTCWIEYDPEAGSVLLHVLDLAQEESWAKLIHERYERPLMEIFP